ncbi:MAG: DUF411 domain-containing protein [Ectothiorhodospiraceae bacterium]|nr:DUF411 domain-containing protein [Ectothiorhodospiraceae bacterium]
MLGLAGAGSWWMGRDNATAPSGAVAALGATEQDIKVYKTPWCGCCTDWVDYLEREGMRTEVVDVDQEALNEIKLQAGLRQELASCHTAFIDGYVVEGHVPVEDIRALLEQRPDGVLGIAVPGMPVGSPGMEIGDRRDPYDVVAFDAEGNTEVFSSYHQ